MMFHKPDDVKECDKSVLAIRCLLDTAENDEIVCVVTSLMRSITWHDWTTDCAVSSYSFENLKPSDGNLVRQFADACVLFLDRPGEKDLAGLRKHADEYLTQRGLQARPPKKLSPQCTISQWLIAFRKAKAFFGEQRKFEAHMKKLGAQGIAYKPTPRASWAVELWYLEEKGIKIPI